MKAKRILASVLSVALLLQLSPLGVLALDESLPQTPQVSTVQENLDPVPTEEPAPTAEPIPEETAVPMAAPTPEPTAEPTATPAEEPAPDAAETPAPEPSAEPTATPDPAAAVQAMIDALPDEVTDDNAEAVAQALTDIDDAKESLTDDELAGLDLTRYDAAANALLALWGEATTDAVETLADYSTPTTEGEWYVIDSVEDLKWLAESAPMNVKAKLTADIKLNGENKVLNDDGSLTSNADTLVKWTPIGKYANPFKGEFDGGGYTISGLYINDSSKNYVGLFGCVENGGTVKNVNVTDSYVSGNISVGGICGWNDGGTVQNCTSDCTVKGTGNSVGGICGSNQNGNRAGLVLNCHNTGKVSGNENVSGVCGYNYSDSIIQGCYNTGTVSGTWYFGGVCGQNDGTLEKCYNTGKVGTGSTGFFVGGVCGYNRSGTVSNCYYLAGTSAKAVGDGTEGTNCASKNKLQFQNGEVAYQLQKDLGGATVPQVWGQRIDPNDTGETDKTPVLNSTSAYTVYKAAEGSPCNRYSNMPDQTFTQHVYNDEYDVCIRCGEWQEATPNGDYYEIHNQGQLRWFAKQVNEQNRPNINARLMANITMDSAEWTPIGKKQIRLQAILTAAVTPSAS